jgi:hypothetical protein
MPSQEEIISMFSIYETSRSIGRVHGNAYQANPDQGENLNQTQKKPNPD